MDTMAVYKLKPELVDPRFDGWVFQKGTTSVLKNSSSPSSDFSANDSMSIHWSPRTLADQWKAQAVTGKVQLFNDYPCVELAIPAFSHRAIDALEPHLTETGELLRLACPVGNYFAYNCLTKVAALNLAKSVVHRRSIEQRSDDINRFVFIKSRLRDRTIFRIPETPNSFFVTDAFKDRVEQAGLNGFTFIKVWPLAAGVDWCKEESARRKKYKRVKLAGQALTLHFHLKNINPSTREKKLAGEIQASLRAEIKVESIREKYLGTVESSEFAEGELRIACTCPDCDVLAEHLSDWLAQLAWEHAIDIVKRYGNLYGTKAKEKRVGVRPMPH